MAAIQKREIFFILLRFLITVSLSKSNHFILIVCSLQSMKKRLNNF